MGTRHLVAVYVDGEYKVAQFGQFDGYPRGAGVKVLSFVKFLMKENLLEEFKNKVRASGFFTAEEYHNKYSIDLNLGEGADILGMILNSDDGFKTVNSINFAGDSLWCEWAWIIDLDKGTFEGYKGFNDSHPLHSNERFYFLDEETPKSGYHPVILVRSWNLDRLPSDSEFVSIMQSDYTDDDCTENDDTQSVDRTTKDGLPFDSFDSNRYLFLEKEPMYKYCAELTAKLLDNRNLVIVPTEYTGNKVIIVNKRTNRVYTSRNRPCDEYVKLYGIAIAAAKATGGKIPILIKEKITDINQIKEGTQLIIWFKEHKKPYNQEVTSSNLRYVRSLLEACFKDGDIKKNLFYLICT